jgi:hypothetical protein
MANSALSLVSLDFDTLKANFKSYLKSQSVFRDYDFEGSNMNVLLDVLSYNSYLNSFYLNMAVSEGFLDTAQSLSSVISHAKELNYTPRSALSAKAIVNLTINILSGSTNSIEIPKGTPFSGTNANGNFVYTTAENHILTSTSSSFSISNLAIYEGTYINETFIIDNSIGNQKFILSNKNVDTTSIAVTVAENDGLNVTDYSQATNLYGLTNTSTIYFIQATLDGSYEIVFGDGVFGYMPQNNATLLVTYRITNGITGNGISQFNIDKDIGAYNNVRASVTVSTISASVDGDNAESIESIRYRAPRHYQTQDRAIITSDYANLIYENFPEVKAVNVYGGETLYGSVEYGKVFISTVSRSGATITNILKTDIINYLSNKNSIAITPVIIDPDFLYIVPTIIATVNFNQTNMSSADVNSLLLTSISSYNSSVLQNFNMAFRYSKFLSALNNVDPSIESIQLSNLVKKIASPSLNHNFPISFLFNNQLVPGTILSSQFLLSDGNTYVITDYNPNNNTFVRTGSQSNYNIINTNKVVYLKQITSTNNQNYIEAGVINYDTGSISIKSITVVDFLGSPGIICTGATKLEDIYAIKNDLIEFDLDNINISVVSA